MRDRGSERLVRQSRRRPASPITDSHIRLSGGAPFLLPAPSRGDRLSFRRMRGHPLLRVNSKFVALAAESELSDQRLVPLLRGASKVVQQSASLANQLEQAPPRMMIFLVSPKVILKAVDPFGQERHLNFRRAGVLLVRSILINQLLLTVGANHARTLSRSRAHRSRGLATRR